MASKKATTQVLMDRGSGSGSNGSDDVRWKTEEEEFTRLYASMVAGIASLSLKPEKEGCNRSYASVVAEAGPTERKQSSIPDAIVEAEPKPEPYQSIGPLERARSQLPKKPTGYYWPSWRHFPALKHFSPPLQPPTQDRATPIPKIIISEPTTSSISVAPRRMDKSKLAPRTIARRKVPRKAIEKGGTLGELAPKPSVFSYDICTHPRCPVSRAHDKGGFHHGDEDRYRAELRRNGYDYDRMPFWLSNPPPEVWKAWDRIRGIGGERAGDVEIVEGYKAAHVDLGEEEDEEDGEEEDDMDSGDEEEGDIDFGENWDI
ncbi:MAG: hypothetical protein Q9195_007756 [Heterodermia aff. obscurata]